MSTTPSAALNFGAPAGRADVAARPGGPSGNFGAPAGRADVAARPGGPSGRPRRFAAAALLALAAALPAAPLEIPFLSGRIVDQADLLPPDAEARIEAKLAALEQATGSQVAVLTVPTLEDEPIEDWSLRVVETWKLGREGKDDGALLLISRDDRQMRIEVGYGVEGLLTDALSSRILDQVMAPRFRAGDFVGGIEAAVDAIDAVLRGNPEAVPPEPLARRGGGEEVGGRVAMFGVFLLVVGSFSLAALRAPGAAAWFMYVFLTPFYFFLPAAAFGAVAGVILAGAWLLLFPLLRLLLRRTRTGRRWAEQWRKLNTGRSYRSSGGWGGGGFGGWGGGGFGGGGGGGFSGGGGSFGGGGASGRW